MVELVWRDEELTPALTVEVETFLQTGSVTSSSAVANSNLLCRTLRDHQGNIVGLMVVCVRMTKASAHYECDIRALRIHQHLRQQGYGKTLYDYCMHWAFQVAQQHALNPKDLVRSSFMRLQNDVPVSAGCKRTRGSPACPMMSFCLSPGDCRRDYFMATLLQSRCR